MVKSKALKDICLSEGEYCRSRIKPWCVLNSLDELRSAIFIPAILQIPRIGLNPILNLVKTNDIYNDISKISWNLEVAS